MVEVVDAAVDVDAVEEVAVMEVVVEEGMVVAVTAATEVAEVAAGKEFLTYLPRRTPLRSFFTIRCRCIFSSLCRS